LTILFFATLALIDRVNGNSDHVTILWLLALANISELIAYQAVAQDARPLPTEQAA
jgi:hypothetical protein